MKLTKREIKRAATDALESKPGFKLVDIDYSNMSVWCKVKRYHIQCEACGRVEPRSIDWLTSKEMPRNHA